MTREELERKVAEAVAHPFEPGKCECGEDHCDEYPCECACPGCPNMMRWWQERARAAINVVLEAAATMVTDEGYRPFLHADGTVCAIGGSTDAVARIRRAIAAGKDEVL